MTMTLGSLFTGYGGLDIGCAAVFGDIRTSWVSDVEPGPLKILNHRYPHATQLGDITKIDWTTIQPVDIIADRRFGEYAPAIRRQERAFGYPAPDPTEPNPRTGRPQLSARFTEWMMGLEPGWITDVPGITRAEAIRMCGNGVVPQQAAAALTFLATLIEENNQ